jgi:methylmalonyl-CoA/ethylmalonyl-CoA epimerase
MKTDHIDLFGVGARFHHIGLVVDSIARVSEVAEAVTDPIQRVTVAFVELNGISVELLEPAGDDSPIHGSLKRGTKLVHLCYEVPDLEKALEHCRQHGLRQFGRSVPAVVFDERRIAWVFSSELGLFELLEAV